MIMPREKEPSPLVGAARALDAELERLEALAARSQREPLNSQRNMERAARTLGGVTELEETIRGALARLVEAMEGVGARQNAAMAALGARAKELEARFGSFKELVARRDQLGEHGQRVNESIRQLLATGGGAAAIGPNIAATLAEVRRISEESEALLTTWRARWTPSASSSSRCARSSGTSRPSRAAREARRRQGAPDPHAGRGVTPRRPGACGSIPWLTVAGWIVPRGGPE